MHDVRLLEAQHRVAVRVRGRHVDGLDGLAVQVKRGGAVEGDHRQCDIGGRLGLGVEELGELGRAHALADVVMGYDEGSRLAEILVAAGMIEMPVGIEYHLHRLVADGLDCGRNLGRQGRHVVVHDENAVGPAGHRDISADTHQYMQVLVQRYHLDLDVFRGRHLGGCGSGEPTEHTGTEACQYLVSH